MSSISLNTLLRIARSGILTQQFSIDSIASNIANVNTTGYKRTRAEFEELLAQAQSKRTTGRSREIGQAAGAAISANQRMFEQGEIEASGRKWDMAIEGEGFFQIQLPDGTTAYTRDGSFQLDGEGRLTTANGYFLSPQVTIPPDAADSFVTNKGELLVRRRGETEPQIIDTLNLARFNNPAGLESIGNNLYRATAASGEAETGAPLTGNIGQIISGALETSNVDLSREMVDLVSAQRAYSLMTRVLRTSDNMLSLVNRMRG